MRRLLSAGLGCAASLAIGLAGTGCVSYQTYQQTKSELEKAKEANADLVKKYNQAIQKLMAKEKGSPDQGALLAELRRLQEELARRATPDFKPSDIARVPGARSEGGGIQLGEALLFSEGSDRLKPDAQRTLDELLALLRTEYPGEMVIIEGHTDNKPLDRTAKLYEGVNMNLGYARAKAVFRYFLDHGLPEDRMICNTFSFNKPLDPATASTEEGRRANRRVVIRRGGTKI
jgi:outer membrane protein OmpA-like peptidoglycan-associated protein